MNKESKREYYREYRKKNREKRAEYHKKYYEQNKEKEAARRKEYYEQNREKISESRKQQRTLRRIEAAIELLVATGYSAEDVENLMNRLKGE